MRDVAHKIAFQVIHLFQHGVFFCNLQFLEPCLVQTFFGDGKADGKHQRVAKREQNHSVGTQIEDVRKIGDPLDNIYHRYQQRRTTHDRIICPLKPMILHRQIHQHHHGEEVIQHHTAADRHRVAGIDGGRRHDIIHSQRPHHRQRQRHKPLFRFQLQHRKGV